MLVNKTKNSYGPINPDSRIPKDACLKLYDNAKSVWNQLGNYSKALILSSN